MREKITAFFEKLTDCKNILLFDVAAAPMMLVVGGVHLLIAIPVIALMVFIIKFIIDVWKANH